MMLYLLLETVILSSTLNYIRCCKPSTNGSVVEFSILFCFYGALSSTESGYMKKVWYKLAKGKC